MASEENPPVIYLVKGSPEGKPPRLYMVTNEKLAFKEKSNPTSAIPTNNSQLRIKFCIARIFAIVLFAVAVIGLVLILFSGKRFHLFSVEVSEIGDAERKKLLDKYNSRFSNVMSVVNKAIEITIQPLVAVGILCLGAKWFTSKRETSLLVGMAPTLIAAALGFLLCNGPTSINVQLVPGKTRFRMLTEDLQTLEIIPTYNGSAWNSSLVESAPNNSVLNTMLRSQYVPAENILSTCKYVSSSFFSKYGMEIDLPHVTFSFPASSWLLDALPTAAVPQEILDLPIRGGESAGSIDEHFPGGLTAARTLYIMTLFELYGNLVPLWGLNMTHGNSGDFYKFINESRASAIDKWAANATAIKTEDVAFGDMMAFAGDDFVPAAGMMLKELLSEVPNIIIDEVSASYQLLHLADSVIYTSLTLTIPTRTVDAENVNQSVPVSDQCAPDGCLLFDDTLFGTATNEVAPAVKAAKLCGSYVIPGYSESNCSLLLSSLGVRVSGDEFKGYSDTTDESITHISATELRTTYSLTVGMLNLAAENLSDTFGVECADESTNCYGYRLSTDTLEKHNEVVLTNQLLDGVFAVTDYFTASLAEFFNDWVIWKKLVHIDQPQFMLLPRNFARVDTATKDFFYNMGDSCSYQADTYLQNTVRSHLFGEESLQVSYAAGLHFIFRTGVMHTMSSSDDGWTIDLSGNTISFITQVSIPFTNCILSIVGCCALVALSLAIVATRTHGKSIIEGNSTAPVLAEALANADKFPRLLLNLSVEQFDMEEGQTRLIELDQMKMVMAEFVEKKPSI